MFAVEYFPEFRELYTTRENKNRENMGVVSSKRAMWIQYVHGVIVSLL